jgi:choline dehydrogenase-like flavoprotein
VNVADTHLPTFRTSSHGTLIFGATATRILYEANGRITGIRLEQLAGPPRTARARVYVIACGGVETARLLLLSKGTAFPNGIGNHSDLVGRCFMEHPSVCRGMGTVRGPFDPSARELVYSEQFVAAAKQRGFGGVRLRIASAGDRGGGNSPAARRGRKRGAEAGEPSGGGFTVKVVAQLESEPWPGNRVTLCDNPRDALGNPGASLSLSLTENDRRTIAHGEELVRRVLEQLGAENVTMRSAIGGWPHHHMGTCRMGNDPQTSVVDANLRVHGTENLYVAGSAPFVTGSVANPTLTIVALSLRLADHLKPPASG